MKFKKSIIIILLFLALVSIPISFASDLDTSVDSSQLQDNNLLINHDLEKKILEDTVNSDSNLNYNNLNENNLDEEPIRENSEIDESSLYEASSNNKSSSSNLESGTSTLPDLDTSFSKVKIICSDENTIYVNASYAGDEEDGTKLKPFKSISKGFEQLSRSSDKTNIFIAKGSYSITSRFNIYKSINVIGENPQNTIINGSNKTGIFYIPYSNYEINIFNLTLSNGLDSKGGAIYVSKSCLNIINAIFYNNHANNINNDNKGGALYNDAGFVKIYNSTFLNNSIIGNSSEYGGVIYNDLGELSVFNSKFINSSIQGKYAAGGAIYNFNGFLTLFNSSIVNTALNPTYHSLGGAICIWNGRNSYIINSTISGNVMNGRYGFGSAIANKGVLLEIINSTISNNYANGISVENSTVYNINGIYNCENTTFKNNTIKTVNSSLILCLEDQLIVSDLYDTNPLGNLPSHYDLREEGLVTSVKNQSPGGDCWAFAVYAALESYLLKTENVTYDFSENNMKNSMYKNGLNGTDWDNGGNHILAFAYLLRGSGPVNESLDPFDAYSTYSPEDLAIEKYVTGFSYIPLRLNYLDNDQIKYALLQYGALYTSIYSRIFSGSNGYSNLSNINQHAVAIVGWDDDYSASNFASTPPGDGAWIIKNSWGKYNGDGGYYYVSYYDATFPGVTDQFSAIAISAVENLSEYKSIYQHDPIGNTYESLGYNSHTAWFANQFTAESNNPLKAFGIYAFGSSSYLVNVTVNGVSKLVQSGNLVGAGYHTVKLNKLINLVKGDIFKITVKLTTPDSLFPIAIESKRGDFSSKASAELNQSFISQDGINWYDISKNTTVSKFYEDISRINLAQTNVCLKAYVAYNGTLSVESKSNSSVFYQGDIIEITLNITNENVTVNDVNVSAILDNSIAIKNVECSKGSFDYSSKVWHVGSLNLGDSIVLKLQLNMTNFEKDFTANFSFSPSEVISSNVSSSLGLKFSFARLTSFVQVKNVSAVVKTQKTLPIKLVDRNSTPLYNKTVVISLLNSSKGVGFTFANVSLVTDKNGTVKFVIDLPAGDYKFLASFKGDNKYGSSNMTFNVSVSKKAAPKISLEKKTLHVNETLKILLKDDKGNALANRTIKVSIINNNGGKYSASSITDNKGIVEVSDLLAGTYSINVTFENDDEYNDSNLKDNFSIVKIGTNITCSNITTAVAKTQKTLPIKLVDRNSTPLYNKTVVISLLNSSKGVGFTFANVSLVTDKNGTVKFVIDLPAGDYKFLASFKGDNKYGSSNMTFNVSVSKKAAPKISLEKKTLYVNETLKILLKDDKGNALANKTINFSIAHNKGGKYSDSVMTDNNGIVEVSDLPAGTYSINVAFENDEEYKDSKLNGGFSVERKGTRIICSNMTTTAVDEKTDGRVGENFTWTLVDSNNNPIANVPMQIGFNGKVYDRMTDGNGVAKLQINLGYKGDYTFAICFLTDDMYNGSFAVAKITVNTQTGSLSAQNKVYSVSAKTKALTATFKSAKGNVVQGKKVKFVVNGRTYSATTNENGVATVNVSLNKKGTYNFTVKYGGESMYSPMSKVAKVIIVN